MQHNLVIVGGMIILSFVSGMLGLGVAFAAIPFLGLFMTDLVHQVQPLSLLLNGITALLAALGFAKSGYVEWKKALPLAAITFVSAPLGSYIVQLIEQKVVWVIYFAAVFYLAYQLFRPVRTVRTRENFKLAAILAIFISIISGFLGVGPGFLLLPTLILLGFEPKKAAGINAFAVFPPSFSALVPHLKTAQWDFNLTITLLIVGAAFSFLGARLTSVYMPGQRLKQLFAVMILIVTAYKIYTLL